MRSIVMLRVVLMLLGVCSLYTFVKLTGLVGGCFWLGSGPSASFDSLRSSCRPWLLLLAINLFGFIFSGAPDKQFHFRLIFLRNAQSADSPANSRQKPCEFRNRVRLAARFGVFHEHCLHNKTPLRKRKILRNALAASRSWISRLARRCNAKSLGSHSCAISPGSLPHRYHTASDLHRYVNKHVKCAGHTPLHWPLRCSGEACTGAPSNADCTADSALL